MRRLVVLPLLALLTACTGQAPATGPIPAQTPSPTAVNLGRTVDFPASDGVTLHGELFGHGPTTVVLSNMGDNDPAPWQQFAPLLAAQGVTVLTYSFRYPAYTNSFTPTMAEQTVPDLTGAIAYTRSQGAQKIVLIGASLGGITTGKVAATAHPASFVIMSAEQDLVGYGLAVTPAELATLTQPKLFIASEDDTNTPFTDTQSFYQHAPLPKQFHSFPGNTHGVHLFATEHGDELRQLLLDFVRTTG
jgi:pimeloyl-ACP methyl ester carboxylesterase